MDDDPRGGRGHGEAGVEGVGGGSGAGADAGGDAGGARRRRPRYGGTHPVKFGQRYKELDPGRYPGMAQHVREQGGTPAGSHVPILVDEVLACLDPQPGEAFLDCTLGAGGHAMAVLPRLLPGGRLVALDRDAEQLDRTRERLAPFDEAVTLLPYSFGWAASLAEGDGGTFDGILADLGVSSMQVDDPARGFSYREDGPLDMRMDRSRGRTAAQLLAEVDEAELADLLRELSDEPAAEAVARSVVAARDRGALSTTGDLARAVLAAQGLTQAAWKARAREGDAGLHPAARTFQAVRIAVNGELEALQGLLDAAPLLLKPGGRVAVLSFHSGEDRRVKHAFRDGLRGGLYGSVADEPVRPSPAEVRSNPRAAPARLRWARRA